MMVRSLVLRFAATALLLGAVASSAGAQAPMTEFDRVAASQAAANATSGPRTVPGRIVPVPTTEISPEMQQFIAGAYPSFILQRPSSPAQWNAISSAVSDQLVPNIEKLRAALGVKVTPITVAGVKAFEITPATVAAANKDRLVMHIHGGGYVLWGGVAGTLEGILMAHHGGYRVISVDYRMPPTAPYPAALDDCMAVWKELSRVTPPQKIGLVGTSTGGGLVLATVLRAKDERLPLPGALAVGTPWSDLSKTGDSYFTNEWADNVVVSWDGFLGAAARLYASGRDLKEPYLSPVYGDLSGFPPTVLTSGTRDIFLSNTVRVHRKLRRASVNAELHVYEGMSHALYLNASTPESREVFTDFARFFDAHLAR